MFQTCTTYTYSAWKIWQVPYLLYTSIAWVSYSRGQWMEILTESQKWTNWMNKPYSGWRLLNIQDFSLPLFYLDYVLSLSMWGKKNFFFKFSLFIYTIFLQFLIRHRNWVLSWYRIKLHCRLYSSDTLRIYLDCAAISHQILQHSCSS